MRSKIAQKILAETSKETLIFVRNYANALVHFDKTLKLGALGKDVALDYDIGIALKGHKPIAWGNAPC